MKFVVDLNVNAWLKAIEIEAGSKDEVKDILKGMSLEEMLETGYERDLELSDIDITLESYNLSVKVDNITYDINEEDLRDNNVKSEEELDLPRTMELKLYDLESEDEDDIEDAIKSEIEFMTDFIVDEFTYEIIKKY